MSGSFIAAYAGAKQVKLVTTTKLTYDASNALQHGSFTPRAQQHILAAPWRKPWNASW